MIRLNGSQIVPTIFPDKTSQVWKIDAKLERVNTINWDFENEQEFLHVAQLVDLLRTMSHERITLIIPYFPYARQDKEVSNKSTFALRTFCKLLKTLDVNDIITYDLHSDVAKEYLPNLTDVSPLTAIDRAIMYTNPDYVVYPDKGAKARYTKHVDTKSVSINKVRNQSTGELQIIGLNEDIDLTNKKVLIVDDICDGGGTFILATNLLKEKGTKEVNLYTTHGIYSKGLTILKSCGINRVFNIKGEM